MVGDLGVLLVAGSAWFLVMVGLAWVLERGES